MVASKTVLNINTYFNVCKCSLACFAYNFFQSQKSSRVLLRDKKEEKKRMIERVVKREELVVYTPTHTHTQTHRIYSSICVLLDSVLSEICC